jgi:hypothetical protein
MSDFLASSDGLSLIKAFVRIEDPKSLRSIVRLVEAIAVDASEFDASALVNQDMLKSGPTRH